MIYLRTGANGAGKTLLTLKEVREKSVKESRPVYYNGRFALKPEKVAEFGWQVIDAKDWQTVPDGAIFLFDEIQNDWPVRKGSQPVPPHVEALAEHRRRGFDFFLITQHPLNIDAFIRRLIGSPGWHQHLKRASGAPLVSVLEWPSVNDQCQKSGAGESGSVKMVPYPREVYEWYESTSLDTAKTKIPFQVWFLVFAVIAVPVMAYLFYTTFYLRYAKPAIPGPASAASAAPGAIPPGGYGGRGNEKRELTPAEYVETYKPRIEGLPHTASRYDEVNRPVDAPYPAACVESPSKGCKCFTQQATLMAVPVHLCKQIVAYGYFMDWHKGPAAGAMGFSGASGGAAPRQAPLTVQRPAQTAPRALPVGSPLSSVADGTGTAAVPVSYAPVILSANPEAVEVDPTIATHRDSDVRNFMQSRRRPVY